MVPGGESVAAATPHPAARAGEHPPQPPATSRERRPLPPSSTPLPPAPSCPPPEASTSHAHRPCRLPRPCRGGDERGLPPLQPAVRLCQRVRRGARWPPARLLLARPGLALGPRMQRPVRPLASSGPTLAAISSTRSPSCLLPTALTPHSPPTPAVASSLSVVIHEKSGTLDALKSFKLPFLQKARPPARTHAHARHARTHARMHACTPPPRLVPSTGACPPTRGPSCLTPPPHTSTSLPLLLLPCSLHPARRRRTRSWGACASRWRMWPRRGASRTSGPCWRRRWGQGRPALCA